MSSPTDPMQQPLNRLPLLVRPMLGTSEIDTKDFDSLLLRVILIACQRLS
jgi:hypothetical protein